jgi:hypothetical protein
MTTTKGRNVVVVGTQWGDEGKGKLVDWLTESSQGVVRFRVATMPATRWSSTASRPPCT